MIDICARFSAIWSNFYVPNFVNFPFIICLPISFVARLKKFFSSSCGKGSQPSQLPDQTKSSKTFTTSAEKFSFNEKSRGRLSSLEQWAQSGKRTLLSGPAKSDHEKSGRLYRKQFYAILSTPVAQIPGTKID